MAMLGLFNNSVELSTKVNMVEKLNSVNKCICSKKDIALQHWQAPFSENFCKQTFLHSLVKIHGNFSSFEI